MSPEIYNTLQTGDPLLLIEAINKIAINSLNFRKQLTDLNYCHGVDLKGSTEAKDFLMLINNLEFQVKNLKKVKKNLERKEKISNFSKKIINNKNLIPLFMMLILLIFLFSCSLCFFDFSC